MKKPTSKKPATTNPTAPWVVDQNYLIRTVTMIQTGKLVAVHPQELVLENAAWIADTGRFSNALQTGKFSEVEPFSNPIIVGRAAIIDATQIGNLPTTQK